MLEFFAHAFSPLNFFLALIGVACGTIVGSIPGLTATMAVAILVPITFTMAPVNALILLGAIYTGAIYGGAYAAILLNTPGTPSAIATTFDGYPMAKRGDGELAVSVACLSSVFGGLTGGIALLVLAPPLARAALAFGPVEYFWLAIFGLTLIAALSSDNILKGMIGACFGMLLASIGISETSAEVRYTFDSTILLGGIEIVSALIGLYCVPVLIDLVATKARHLKPPTAKTGFRLREAFAIILTNKINLVRSSFIGTLIGALPGAGGSIAGLLAYSEARRSAKGKVPYGKGNPGGVVATESANNATVGGGFIPTLVLGIPGTPPDAVILGALLVQGVRPGPALFADSSGIVYTFIFGLLLATVLMLPVGLIIGRFAYDAITRSPKSVLVPVVAFMTVIGSFSIRNSLSDVGIMIILGIIGWLAGRRGFSASPIVLGLILARIAEQGFVQGWTIGNALGDVWGEFFGRPLSLIIIVLALISVTYPFWPRIRRLFLKDQKPPKPRPKATTKALIYDLLSFAVFAVVAVVALVEGAGLNSEAFALPRVIATGMLVLSVLAALFTVINSQAAEIKPIENPVRCIAVPLTMLGAVAIIPLLGFMIGGIVMTFILVIVAQHEKISKKAWIFMLMSVFAIVIVFTFAFRTLLGVPLPSGLIFF